MSSHILLVSVFLIKILCGVFVRCSMFMLINKQLHTQPSFLSDNPDTCNSNYSESFLFGIFFFDFVVIKLKKTWVKEGG